MTLLRIMKRAQASINNDTDFNSSVFRYFVAGQEVKRDIVKSGLKPAFLGMLDVLFLPNSSDFTEFSDWTFSNPLEAEIDGSNGNTVINTYEGVKYIYRPSDAVQLTPLVPAKLNGFTGKTYKKQMQMVGYIYVQTSDLNEITHAEFIEDDQPSEIVDIEVVGGESRILPTFSVSPAGYFPVQMGETGTHGKDDTVFRPLSFWDEIVIGSGIEQEFTGLITEEKSGFKLDSKKIGLVLTESGEALSRFKPIEIFTFTELIKMHYNYRETSTFEGDL